MQRDFLEEFFRHESHFFLTGGAALSGFYFGHRLTADLDLFTTENEIENGVRIVLTVAHSLGASVEPIQTAPDFRRFLVGRGDESIVVDLIREYVFQVEIEKPQINGIRVDSPAEIFANKLCALLSRSEIRDLIDVYELEKSGLDLTSAIEHAIKKDSGLTPGQLAWVLGQIEIGDSIELPESVTTNELREYLAGLVTRLSVMAYP